MKRNGLHLHQAVAIARQQSLRKSPSPTVKFKSPCGIFEAPIPHQFSQGDILIKYWLILFRAEMIVKLDGLFLCRPARIGHVPYLVPMLKGSIHYGLILGCYLLAALVEKEQGLARRFRVDVHVCDLT